MTRDQAIDLVEHLQSALRALPGSHLDDDGAAAYAARLQRWDHQTARRAIEWLIDTADRFPSPKQLQGAYARCNDSSWRTQQRRGKPDTTPLTAQEWESGAVTFMQVAADWVTQHGAAPHRFHTQVEELCEVYAANAQRVRNGQPVARVPYRLQEMLQALEMGA